MGPVVVEKPLTVLDCLVDQILLLEAAPGDEDVPLPDLERTVGRPEDLLVPDEPAPDERPRADAPLADRMRPRTLDEILGQGPA